MKFELLSNLPIRFPSSIVRCSIRFRLRTSAIGVSIVCLLLTFGGKSNRTPSRFRLTLICFRAVGFAMVFGLGLLCRCEFVAFRCEFVAPRGAKSRGLSCRSCDAVSHEFSCLSCEFVAPRGARSRGLSCRSCDAASRGLSCPSCECCRLPGFLSVFFALFEDRFEGDSH